MKKSLFSAILLLFFINGAVNPQVVSKMPEVEPFKIKRGSSFSASVPRPKQKQLSKEELTADFREALAIIEKNHVGSKKVDYNRLAKFSINAMLRTLDPHSSFFDAAEYQELLTEQRSEYFGIGATIANYRSGGTDETFVVSTFPESPAFRAGLRFGDKIVAVDGEKVAGKSSSYVRDLVRGKRGTIVRIKIERPGSERVETVEIKRNRVPQPSILDAYVIRQNIGYIDLTSGFNYTTFEEFEVALHELRAQGINSLILDLRDNPGGILEQAVKIAEKFLPGGETILTQRGRFSYDSRLWKSGNKNPLTFPLVVLVNQNSASASEIVAGALQDYDRAFIVGEKTFGKGLVQSVINLPYDAGLTLTTAKYYTPSGRSIQRDYKTGDIYDYFNHKASLSESDKKKYAAKTFSGRTIYGGDGIAPDETVKIQELNKTQIELLDPIFFFSRELASGKIANFESFKTNFPAQYGKRIHSNDFIISEELFTVFKEFVSRKKDWSISAAKIEAEKTFIKTKLRYQLATAAYGIVAANQILIENDAQVNRAIAALPRAQQLAVTAGKRRENK